jgi:hypothetical protein
MHTNGHECWIHSLTLAAMNSNLTPFAKIHVYSWARPRDRIRLQRSGSKYFVVNSSLMLIESLLSKTG